MEDHNHSGSGIVDVEDMVDELRARYPEYGRRKRGPFKQSVRNGECEKWIFFFTLEIHDDGIYIIYLICFLAQFMLWST